MGTLMRFLLALVALLPLHAADQLTLTYNDNLVATQTRQYDPETHTTSLWDPTGTYTFHFNDADQTYLIVYPNNLESHFFYNADGLICDIIHQSPESTLSFHYEYDSQDRCILSDRTLNSDTLTTTYSYTPNGYLASVHHSSGHYELYTYDSRGNRLTKQTPHSLIDYEYEGDLLIRAGDTAYTYTPDGYLLSRTSPTRSETFTFDGPLLTRLTTPIDTFQFFYDECGHRTGVSCLTHVEFVPLPAAVLGLYERVRTPLVDDGSLHYVAYASGIIASLHPDCARYYLYNHPDGSVGAYLNNDSVLDLLDCDAFGVPQDPDSPIGFNGEWYDWNTGLYYLGNRYYDPEIGRFISPGSISDHPYTYCSNDPVNLVDPMGVRNHARTSKNLVNPFLECSNPTYYSQPTPVADHLALNIDYQDQLLSFIRRRTSGNSSVSHPSNTYSWRNEGNTDRIDELRDLASEHFENEKQRAYDCVDDIAHGNFGSAMRDVEEGWHEYCAGMRDRSEATRLEYLPDNYEDIRAENGYARRD